MSEFGSVSKNFEESLKEHLGKVAFKDQEEPKEIKEAGSQDHASEFVSRIMQDWLRSLDDGGKTEVRNLFAELNEKSTAKIIQAMKDGGHHSPFSLLAEFFEKEQQHSSEEEIIEIINPERE